MHSILSELMQLKVSKNNNGYQRPNRFFEKSGSVDPEASYYVPLENVVNSDNQDVKSMIDRGRYFSMFAPGQSGKTTFLEELCGQLHRDPTYVAIVLGFQEYRRLNSAQFYAEMQNYLYEQLISRLSQVNCEKTETVRQFLNQHQLTNHISFKLLFQELNRIIQLKKIVVLIDEFDGIPQDELENFLTTASAR